MKSPVCRFLSVTTLPTGPRKTLKESPSKVMKMTMVLQGWLSCHHLHWIDAAVLKIMKRSRESGCGKTGTSSQGDHGPQTLADVLETHLRNAHQLNEHLRKKGVDVKKHWAQLAQAGIVVTSAYSGLGTMELVTSQVLREVAKHVLHCDEWPGLVHYSACEIDPVARSVLLQLPLESRPQHVFGDVVHSVCRKFEGPTLCSAHQAMSPVCFLSLML